MRVEIDDNSGFCFGVVRAIGEAERALLTGEVFSLGDIVHNRIEVQRLEQLGLRTVSHEDLPTLKGCRLLVRAHGEPPSTFERARALGIEVIDATCPVVAKLQGLTGQVLEPTIIVERAEDLEQIDFSRPIFFLSQTTQSVELFEHLREEMLSRLASPEMLTAHDTICRQVSSREKHLEEFARKHDVVIFVCGRKSSNGKVLAEVCRKANPRTYNIEEEKELQAEWFEGAESVGICGATSTPKWLMQQIAEAIHNSKFKIQNSKL